MEIFKLSQRDGAGVDLLDSVVDDYRHGNEALCSILDRKLLDQLSDYEAFKECYSHEVTNGKEFFFLHKTRIT
jgi:hypothetical protein